MPDNTTTFIAPRARCLKCRIYSFIDRMILMIGSNLFLSSFKDNKVSDKVEYDFSIEHSTQENVYLRRSFRRFFFAVNSLPRQEALPIGCNCPGLCVKPIACD